FAPTSRGDRAVAAHARDVAAAGPSAAHAGPASALGGRRRRRSSRRRAPLHELHADEPPGASPPAAEGMVAMRRTSIFLAIALSLLSSAAGAGPAETCNHPAVRSEIQRQMEERLAKRERRVFRLLLRAAAFGRRPATGARAYERRR